MDLHLALLARGVGFKFPFDGPRRGAAMGWLRGWAMAASVAGSAGFPSGLEPVEVNQARPPEPEPGEPHPERLNLVSGSGRGFKWVHARGYVHAPLEAVWSALREPETVVDRRKVASWTVQKGVLPQFPESFSIRHVVHEVITVEFEVTWQLGVAAGTAESPQAVAAVYRKTGGSHVIKLMEGSVVARRVDDRVTEVELVEHLEALMRASESAASHNRDLFASLVARAKGLPLPRY